MVESIGSVLPVLNGCHIAMPLELMDQVRLIVKMTVNRQVHPVELLVIFDVQQGLLIPCYPGKLLCAQAYFLAKQFIEAPMT